MKTIRKSQQETRKRKVESIDRIVKIHLSIDTDTRLNDLYKSSSKGPFYSPKAIWNSCAFFIAEFKKLASDRCIITTIQKKGTFARLKNPS
jgi:hypothetical protein